MHELFALRAKERERVCREPERIVEGAVLYDPDALVGCLLLLPDAEAPLRTAAATARVAAAGMGVAARVRGAAPEHLIRVQSYDAERTVRDGLAYPHVDVTALLVDERYDDAVPSYSTERSNETLITIGKKFGVAPSRLCELNCRYTGLTLKAKLRRGTSVTLPRRAAIRAADRRTPFRVLFIGGPHKGSSMWVTERLLHAARVPVSGGVAAAIRASPPLRAELAGEAAVSFGTPPGTAHDDAGAMDDAPAVEEEQRDEEVSLFCTVTFHTNLAHNLTRSP